MITYDKKVEYWNHCVSVIEKNRKQYRGLTSLRMLKVRSKIFADRGFWMDIIGRHGGIDMSPEEMEKDFKVNYEHMIGNFASWAYEVLVPMGEIKP